MSITLVRDIILILGWPVLICGSIFIFLQSYRFRKSIERNNPFGQLLLILTIGVIVTMYSLGIIATLAMFSAPEKTVPVIIPIFVVWFILILIITLKTRNLDKKARAYNTFIHELDQAKSDFVAMASHQLRTPLTGVKWILERMKNDKELPVAYLADIEKIYLSNEGMIQLVSNILNNTRIETGKLLINKERIDLKKIISEVAANLAVNAQTKQQKIVCNIDSQNSVETYVDRMLFSESLKNLISNAINYGTAHTDITVSLMVEPDMFTISVHNFGSPIPVEERKKIFKKFERHVPGDNQIVPKTEVGGIGLFIAKTFADMNGGSVWFDSVEEKGTTFFFSLPRTHEKASA